MRLTSATRRVMQVFVNGPTEMHYGLEIMDEAGLASGTLYPILRRLEHEGFIAGEWEAVDPSEAGRPARRFYRVAGHGAARMRTMLEGSSSTLSTNQTVTT